MKVPGEAVVQHSTSVSAVADAVEQARAAARITMDPGAYGQLCQFLPVALGVVFEAAVVAMNSSSESLRETALNLRAAVSEFERTDEANGRAIGGGP